MRFVTVSVLLLSLLIATVALAAQMADVAQAPSCKQCSMDRGKFSHSRMVVEYQDGSTVGSCSLHCVAVELANSIDRIPVTLRVADYESKELVDAETAVWVMGGSKRGVMTAKPKWAFVSRGTAERFVKENGGSIVTFDDVMKAAYEDMYQDTKMIREFRQIRRTEQKMSHSSHSH